MPNCHHYHTLSFSIGFFTLMLVFLCKISFCSSQAAPAPGPIVSHYDNNDVLIHFLVGEGQTMTQPIRLRPIVSDITDLSVFNRNLPSIKAKINNIRRTRSNNLFRFGHFDFLPPKILHKTRIMQGRSDMECVLVFYADALASRTIEYPFKMTVNKPLNIVIEPDTYVRSIACVAPWSEGEESDWTVW